MNECSVLGGIRTREQPADGLTLAFIRPDITQRKIINELCLTHARRIQRARSTPTHPSTITANIIIYSAFNDAAINGINFLVPTR